MGQRVSDATGNPLIVSAVLTYRFTNARAALLNVMSPEQFVVQQATSALKAVISKHTYDELKREASEVQTEMRVMLQPKVDVAGATIYSFSLAEIGASRVSARGRPRATRTTTD